MPSHLTSVERDRIAQLLYEGASQKEVAAAIGRSPATVSRELRRNRQGRDYHACGAQQQAERRRRERPLQRKLEQPELEQLVRQGLARSWAPEQIAGRQRLLHPNVVTIYDVGQQDGLYNVTASWYRDATDEAPGRNYLPMRYSDVSTTPLEIEVRPESDEAFSLQLTD
jgi:IS30 family transposase